MKTVAERWGEFWKAIKPELPAENQEKEMKSAFYAGAFTAHCIQDELTELPEMKAVHQYEKIRQEVHGFLAQDVFARLTKIIYRLPGKA